MTLRSRRILIGLAVALGLCTGVPIAGFAGYNLVYFVREQILASQQPTPGLATPIATASATGTPVPMCGGPKTMFVLLVGSDSRADSYATGLADAVRVVRVDFVHPGISYLAFPRDLYVEIPGIESHGGITHGKLNQAYLYGNPAFGYYEGQGQGPGLLAATLEHNFGVHVDHYVALNLHAFESTVDQLGGLDIDLPYTVDGRATRSLDPDRYFPAGPLHLDGYRAMLLARMRPNGDLERLRTQNLILQAFAVKLLSPETLPRLPALAETLYGSTQTDLGASEISSLLCLAPQIDPKAIQGFGFPDEWLTGTRVQDPVLGSTFVWEADFLRLRDYVRKFQEGSLLILTPPPTPSAQP